jgi:hypothetical protein
VRPDSTQTRSLLEGAQAGDREVMLLRHFEGLSNQEAGIVLAL